MLSQAMESVTRAFYSRSDLDLILSSPASARRLFAVQDRGDRRGTTTLLTTVLASPFINALGVLRRAAMARRLRPAPGDGRLRREPGPRRDGRPVPPARSQAHPAGLSSPLSRGCRHLRDRGAGGGDPLHRQPVPLRASALGERFIASLPGGDQPHLVAGPRRHGEPGRARPGAGDQPGSARLRHRLLLRQLRASRKRRGRHRLSRPPQAPRARRLPPGFDEA